MARRLLILAISAVLAAPTAALAQALPDEVRAAGVTLVQWNAVQTRWRQAASEKHVSERALGAVCTKMGIQLAKGRRLEMTQLIALIDSRADEISALNQRLAQQAEDSDPATAALLDDAKAAIDAGDLEAAEQKLDQADATAAKAIENAQRKRAEVRATAAEVKALEFDYLGAAAKYGEAAGLLPADDARGRWAYATKQAGMLEKRGDLFDEPQPLRQAVALYRDTALPLASRDAHPAAWAATQNDLGIALAVLGARGDAQAQAGAIAAYHATLEVETRERDPTAWAQTETNLGNALMIAGSRGDDQALKDAIAAYRVALEVDTRERDASVWAADQSNLGTALRHLGALGEGLGRSDVQVLQDSAAAFRLALEVDTREHDPEAWARDQNNLGDTLLVLGVVLGDGKALHAAAAAFRGAIEVWTRDRDPTDWAKAEANLGAALERIGVKDHDEQALNDAAAAFQAALEVQTRDRDPAHWAMSENGLGTTLEVLGLLGDDKALADAVAAYRSALEVLTPSDYPAYAKGVSANLARAEAALAGRQQH